MKKYSYFIALQLCQFFSAQPLCLLKQKI